MRILLTGKTGQVGSELVAALSSLGTVIACDRNSLDLADPGAIISKIRAVRPGIIVNAAAYTAVDRAESEPELAMAVNGTAPGILAEEAAREGALLVHYSTDYIFDGAKQASYDEDDIPNPLSVYGQSKLAGERAIQATSAKYLILRTSWVYGATGKNFLVTILRLAAEREEIRVVDDQTGAPTWCRDIASATAAILKQITGAERSRADVVRNIYNLTAQGSTSWYELASAILAHTPAPPARPKARLIPIPTSGYPTAARRPANSVLSHDKLRRTFGIELPHWLASLRTCLDAA